MIPNTHPDKTNPVTVSELSITYMQEKDSNDSGEELQFLDIRTEDAGGGCYFIIKTDRWAFDKVEDIIKLLEDFKSRFC